LVFANELREQTGIVNVGVSNRHPGYILSSTSGFDWPGKNPDETILFHTMGVDEYYMSTMEMNILEGRPFTHTDSAVVMINEKAKEIMGMENPIGELLTASGERKIVGVVEDFNFKSIHTAIEPIVIFKLSGLNRVFIKYDPEEAENIVQTVEGVWLRLLPDREFDYYFLEEDFKEMYAAEQRTSTLSTYFAGLAILISCLGLFGLVSYATEQRTKEVGIRKVLGASVQNLFLLLTGDFTRLVLISLFISIPIGWFAMGIWLGGFAYHIDLNWWIFVFSGASALAIAILTVSYQSIRASISNPVHALRNE
jgi:ABC-type antimicrobial peptide transport system permease subunit